MLATPCHISGCIEEIEAKGKARGDVVRGLRGSWADTFHLVYLFRGSN